MSQARPLLIAAHAVASVGAGLLIGWGLELRPSFGMTQFEPVVLVPSVIAVVAALVALAPRAIRVAPGWTVAALGAVLFGAVAQLRSSPGLLDGLIGWLLLVALAVGLVLGGALLALGGETGVARLVIAAGIPAGVLLRPTMIYLMTRDYVVSGPGASTETVVAYGIASVLIAVAVLHGVIARLVPAAATPPTDPAPRGPVPSAVVVAGVAVAAVVVNTVLTGVIDRSPAFAKLDLPVGSVGAAVNLAASAGLAAAIGLALAWLAYRQGGIDAARWAVVGCAVALPLAYLPDALAVDPVILSVAALAGVGVGASGAWLADAAVPWDVVGVLGCAVALVLDNPRFGLGSAGSTRVVYAVLLVGVGVTLGAGLTRLARRSAGADGPGFVTRAVPGFAAIILVGQVLVPISARSYASGVLASGVPVVVIMFGLVLLVFFGLGRRRESAAG